MRSDFRTDHTWALVGEIQGGLRPTGVRSSLRMLSAISAQGEMRFMAHDGSVRADTFRESLARLSAGMERRIYLMVDGHAIHTVGKVKKHVAAQITLFSLPLYSPDLSADAWVSKQVKQRIARQSVRPQGDLTRVAWSALRSRQQVPEKIRGFLRGPCLLLRRSTSLAGC